MGAVARKLRPPPALALIRDRLGAASDQKLADEAGLSVDVVRYWRLMDGKAAWQAKKIAMPPPPPRAPNAWLLDCGPRLARMAKARRAAVQNILEDEAQALAFVEAARWPGGRLCPHCGSDDIFVSGTRALSAPLCICKGCEGRFNVRTGSILQESSISLGRWLRALCLLEADPRAATTRGMAELLPVSHVSAWKLLKRVQAARLGEARWERYKSAPAPDPSTDELRAELKKALRLWSP